LDSQSYSDYEAVSSLLRGKQYFLYDEFVEYSNDRRIIGYDFCVHENYPDIGYPGKKEIYKNEHANTFTYDSDGKLLSITERPVVEDIDWWHWEGLQDYTGLIEVGYHANGNPSLVRHAYFPHTHGTWDGTGRAVYDEQGRMIFRSHYVTSGGYTHMWLYEGASKRPWAHIEWGGMYYSGAGELDYYSDISGTPDWITEATLRSIDMSYGCETIVRIYC